MLTYPCARIDRGRHHAAIRLSIIDSLPVYFSSTGCPRLCFSAGTYSGAGTRRAGAKVAR